MSPVTVPLQAHLRAEGEVHLGLGGARERIVSGLTEAETRAVLALGPMTPGQWGSARIARPPSKRWPSVVRLLGDAAASVTTADEAVGGVRVAGTGDVCDAVREVVDAMGATRTMDDQSLAVLFAGEHVPAAAGSPWQRHGLSHLPVVIGAGRAVIGPLIRPGRGPCLRCLDHYRADHDPGWRHIATESWIDRDDGLDYDDVDNLLTPVSAPADLRAVVAGLVGLVIRGHRIGRPLPVGVSLTVASPDPRVQHRLWRSHPRCCPNA